MAKMFPLGWLPFVFSPCILHNGFHVRIGESLLRIWCFRSLLRIGHDTRVRQKAATYPREGDILSQAGIYFAGKAIATINVTGGFGQV